MSAPDVRGQTSARSRLRPEAKGEDATLAAAERVGFVLTRAEHECLVGAARALRVTLSQLVYTATLEAAHRLGYFEGYESSRPRPGTWQDVPRRHVEDTATERLTVTVAPIHLRTIQRAAREQLGEGFRLAVHGKPAPVQAFMLGSTLRFISTHLEQARAACHARGKRSPEQEEAAAFLAQVEGPFAELLRRMPAGLLRPAAPGAGPGRGGAAGRTR